MNLSEKNAIYRRFRNIFETFCESQNIPLIESEILFNKNKLPKPDWVLADVKEVININNDDKYYFRYDLSYTLKQNILPLRAEIGKVFRFGPCKKYR